MPLHIDKEKAKKTIALVLDKMGAEVDSALLDEYHSLFKKEVSLFRRSRAAACLLMLCDQEKNIHSLHAEKPLYRKPGKDQRSVSAPVQPYPLAEEDSKWLFFSAGRSRRVFPREILGLLNTKTAIPKEDIGAIRILDNYSFVQVRDSVAEKIIEALNGVNFRGRPLVVNYAKSRKDEENTAAENGEAAYGDTGSRDDDVPGDYFSADDSGPEDLREGTSGGLKGLEQNQYHSEEEDIETYSGKQ